MENRRVTILFLSPDMTQSPDNINVITSRHMLTTVFHFNDMVHIAADMKTQSNVRDDKVQTISKLGG